MFTGFRTAPQLGEKAWLCLCLGHVSLQQILAAGFFFSVCLGFLYIASPSLYLCWSKCLKPLCEEGTISCWYMYGNSYWGWDISELGKFPLSRVAFNCSAWFSPCCITAAGWPEIWREAERNSLLWHFSIKPPNPFVKVLELKSEVESNDFFFFFLMTKSLDCGKRNVCSLTSCTVPLPTAWLWCKLEQAGVQEV